MLSWILPILFLLNCSALSTPFRSPPRVQSSLTPRPESSSSSTYGPNNFGDIISDRSINVFINGDYSPLERIVLSANGNLQRILSAYHGQPVHIEVVKCFMLNNDTFHREVNLMLGDRRLCTARGEIQVHCERCLEDISSKRVGVGQLFRYLGVLPSFNLLAVGRVSASSPSPTSRLFSEDEPRQRTSTCLWREYELSCPQLSCRFVEQFECDFLDTSESRPDRRD